MRRFIATAAVMDVEAGFGARVRTDRGVSSVDQAATAVPPSCHSDGAARETVRTIEPGARPRNHARCDSNSVTCRPPAERMNSPLENRKVRLRGLGGRALYGVRSTCVSATRRPPNQIRNGHHSRFPRGLPRRPEPPLSGGFAAAAMERLPRPASRRPRVDSSALQPAPHSSGGSVAGPRNDRLCFIQQGVLSTVEIRRTSFPVNHPLSRRPGRARP